MSSISDHSNLGVCHSCRPLEGEGKKEREIEREITKKTKKEEKSERKREDFVGDFLIGPCYKFLLYIHLIYIFPNFSWYRRGYPFNWIPQLEEYFLLNLYPSLFFS